MATVKICGVNIRDEERKLTLNNGDIIVALAQSAAVGYFMVTSFRGPSREPYATRTTDTRKYCTLIDLSDGYTVFDEPCSRSTTLKRVLSHIRGIPHTKMCTSDDIIQLKSKGYDLMITPVEGA